MTRQMGDSTNALNIPATVQVAAGYINGVYEWSAAEWARFPAAKYGLVRIDVTGQRADTADVVDCETGDVTPVTAAEWCASWHALKRGGAPTVYCNRATQPQVVEQCTARGLVLGHDYLLWVATLDGTKVSGPGIVAVQFGAHGTWDESDVFDGSIWLPVVPPVPVKAKTTLPEALVAMATISDYLEGK